MANREVKQLGSALARHTGQQEGEALAVEEIGNASPEGQHDPNPYQGLEQNAISISTIYFKCS